MTTKKSSPEVLLLRHLGIDVESGPMVEVVEKAFDRERLAAYQQGRSDERALHKTREIMAGAR